MQKKRGLRLRDACRLKIAQGQRHGLARQGVSLNAWAAIAGIDDGSFQVDELQLPGLGLWSTATTTGKSSTTQTCKRQRQFGLVFDLVTSTRTRLNLD